MFSSSLSSFRIAQASEPLRVQMYDPHSKSKTKATVKGKRKLKNRGIHRDLLENALSIGIMDNEQAVSPMGKEYAPGLGTAVQSALLMSLKSFDSMESRESNLSIEATNTSGLETWHPTGLDHAAAHVVEMEEDNQASQIDRLCHKSELVNASEQPKSAQESCCANIQSVDQTVMVDESITSSGLQTIVKRPCSPSLEMSLLPEPNSGTSKEPQKRDVQLVKRRRILGSPSSEVACGELGSRSVSTGWSDLTNEEDGISENRAEGISTLSPCMVNECFGDDSSQTSRKMSPYASVSLVSFDSKYGEVFADVGIPSPRCDNDYNLHTVGSEAKEEAETDCFEVKRVLAHRVRGRQIFYCVKWKGYSEPTWEPADHLDNCAELLEEYWSTLHISSEEIYSDGSQGSSMP